VRGRDGGRWAGSLREPRPASAQDAPAGAITPQLIALLRDRATVEEFIRRGKKIDAIKEFRAQALCGLRDAKEAVEAMEREVAGRTL
ncbi:MAG: hypothetical protein C0506_13945, partial [Anaerolinea sp.]|nr:hypothetical protein [Anaerolinea sp.]